MNGWVDIHCHVLPGVDDSAVDMETSLDMLRSAVDEGLEQLVVTPTIRPMTVLRSCACMNAPSLVSAVAAAGLPIDLRLGAELGFRFGLDYVAADPAARLSGGAYVLVDLPPGPVSPGLEQAFFALRTAGWRPILAHPERHRELARRPERIERLREQDLMLQVNAGSLVGQFGRRAMDTSTRLIERGWADFVASDGHDVRKRRLSIRAAAEQLNELVGTQRTYQLLVENPACVMTGELVEPYRPQPVRRKGGIGQWIQRRFSSSAATRG